MILKRLLRTFFRYLLVTALSLFLLLLLVTGLTYFLAVSDQEKVPELVEQISLENFGASATFDHYRFQYIDHFPFLSLSLEEVVLRDPAAPAGSPPLLKVGEVTVLFRPWKLLRKEFEIKSLLIDRADIQLRRTAEGYFSAAFLRRDTTGERSFSGFSPLFSIDEIRLESLAFNFLDSLHGKHHRFELSRTEVVFEQRDSLDQLQLRGDCFFHGLTFKMKNGPFLPDQSTRIDLRLQFPRGEERIDLQPSTLRAGPDRYDLSGFFIPSDPGYLQLIIANEGVPLTNIRALLAANLQRALAPYHIDQPVKTRIRIEGPTGPDQAQPVHLRFSVRDATVASKTLRFTHAHLEGAYRNNCDTTGLINPHTDCLTLETFTGKLFDHFPVLATYHAQDLKDPAVVIKGTAAFPLPALGAYLPEETFALTAGEAEVGFTYHGRPTDLLDASILNPDMQMSGRATIRGGDLLYLPNQTEIRALYARLTFDEKTLRMEDVRLDLNRDPFRLSGRLPNFIPFALGKSPRLRVGLRVTAPRIDFAHFDRSPERTAPPRAAPDTPFGRSFAAVIENITEKLEADFDVRAGEVVYRKLQAEDVHFSARFRRDCRQISSQTGTGSCLLIEELTAGIYDGIPLQASLRITDMRDPKLEMKAQLSTPLAKLHPLLPSDQLHLRSGRIDLAFRYEGRLSDYFDLKTAALNARISGTAALSKAAINYLPARYQLRAVSGSFRFDEKDLYVDSLGLTLNDNQLRAVGRLTGFLPFLYAPEKEKLAAYLEVYAPRLDLNRFRKEEKPEKEPDRGRTAAANPIAIILEAALAKVKGDLRVRADTLRFRSLQATEVTFASLFTGECDGRNGAAEDCIRIDSLSARLFGHAPLRADLIVSNLNNPFFSADAYVQMPLRDLNRVLAPSRLRFGEGRIEVRFRYKGYPDDAFDLEKTLFKASLRGEAAITGGTVDYPSRGYRFSALQGDFSFDEKDLTIRKLTARLNKNEIRAEGAVRSFLPFLFFEERRKLEADLVLSSPQFDLDQFEAPQKFQDETVAGAPPSTSLAGLTDTLLANLEANLAIDLDRVSYRDFRADSVSGHLNLTADRLRFRDTRMQIAGGSFQLDGQVSGLQENEPFIDIETKFRETDISQIFSAFSNFGQTDLTHENIRGILSASASFRARADANYDVDPATMMGRFDLSVRKGALLRVPVLMDMNSILFKKGEMQNIRFATLENTFDLRGQDLLIDHFYIFASALTFGVEGRYCLGSGRHTDLLFEVPVSNLFRSDLNKEALESLKERGTGLSILLRATEPEEGKLIFKWLLSRRPFEQDR